jgi:RNA polymerase sigma factor, sigma-70 family
MAEDLRQETFLKAILSLQENHTNMRAWLYLVARNLCFNRLKKEKRFVPLEKVYQDGVVSEETENILETLMKDEQIRTMYQALSEMSQQKKEILTMQYFGKLSQREIAAILQLTPENVRVLSYRAKKELKLYMEAKKYDLS